MLRAMLLILGSFCIHAFAVSDTQVRAVMSQVSPLLQEIKGVNGIEISSCYVGTDNLIRPGTLPASEECIAVGFVAQDQLDQAKAIFASPLKVQGVGVALYLLGPAKPQ